MIVANRVLNRTLLARQRLLERSEESVPELVEHLVGLQAQDVPPAFIALWSRLADFDPAVVSAGLDDRTLGRITLMRGTIHLVTARDAVRIAPHIQPELEKVPFRKGFNFGATVGLDPEEVRRQCEPLLDDTPTTAAILRDRVAQVWPDRNASAMLQVLLYLLPVTQTPPRGRWGDNSRPTWSRVEPWYGVPFDQSYPVDELVLRYLAAFGPASTMDMQAWSRLTGMKAVVTRLGDRLRTYTDDRGRTLYDLAEATLADPDTPAPVRYLGWYDNALLSHQDRTRVIPDGLGVTGLGDLARNVSTVLVDGYAVALYKIAVTRGVATLRLLPRVPMTPHELADVEGEGMRLLAFLHGDQKHEYEVLAQDATFPSR